MLTPSTIRLDLKCGKGAISQGEKCTKGTATKAAIGAGIGLTAGAIAIGVLGARRRTRTFSGSSGGGAASASSPRPKTPKPSGPPRLPGSTPYGLLSPARARKSKTQRMRENTQAATLRAERAVGRAAQAEITRAGAVANAMAATGEATGMAVKTTLRELRLRTEAARRRYEPGYRSMRPEAPQAPKMLQPGDPALQTPFTPQAPLTPERVRAQHDPRTGQPRRRKARGFQNDSAISFSHPAYVAQP